MRTRRLNQHHTIMERPAPRRLRSGESQSARPPMTVDGIAGGQGRTAADVRSSGRAWALCAIAFGAVALLIVLPRVAGWLT